MVPVPGLLPAQRSAPQAESLVDASDVSSSLYPPALTGFCGSHVGSFEIAHELAWHGRRDSTGETIRW